MIETYIPTAKAADDECCEVGIPGVGDGVKGVATKLWDVDKRVLRGVDLLCPIEKSVIGAKGLCQLSFG